MKQCNSLEQKKCYLVIQMGKVLRVIERIFNLVILRLILKSA